MVSECFQTFFHSVFNPPLPTHLVPVSSPALFSEFPQISPSDVLSVIRSLPRGKPPGFDSLRNELFLGCADAFSQLLSRFFNLCLRECRFPLEWKSVIVNPIFKSGDRTGSSNYRPITLSSVVLKILERLLYRPLLEFLDSRKVIPHSQFGFRPNRSVQDQLVLSLDFISKGLNSRENVVGVFFDFQKAFDKIPTSLLLRKLENVGVSGSALRFFEFYLCDRTQRVKVGESLSTSREVTSGVPQGSVLGPLLFLVFVSDIPSLFTSETLALQFADDLKLLRVMNSEHDREMLESDVRSVLQWSERNHMPLNLKKCKIVEFGNSQSDALQIVSSPEFAFFQVVDEERDLGVVFDSKLKFKSHVKSVVAKANFVLHRVSTTFRNFNHQRFAILYQSLVRPLLEFCSPVWSPSFKTLSNSIEKIQKRATKLIPGLRNLSYSERLRSLRLDTLEFRRKRESLIHLYKINRNPLLCNSLLSFRPRTGTRGHAYVLMNERCHAPSRRNFLTNRVRSVWNDLPPGSVNSPTLNQFKNSLRCLPGSWRCALQGGRGVRGEGLPAAVGGCPRDVGSHYRPLAYTDPPPY